MKSQRAFGVLEVVLTLAIVALLAPKVAPKLFDSRTKEAEKSKDTTTALVAANDNRAAAQTASAQVIGEAAADLPPSEDRSFILNEVPIMLSRGPAPDAKQIIAARDRRIAFLEGNLAAQKELTDKALKDAGSLAAKLAMATAEKAQADSALVESAALARGQDLTIAGIAFVGLLIAGAYLWLKNNSLPFARLGEIKAMVQKGEATVEQAFDSVIDRRYWGKVAKATDAHFYAKDFKP